jgi:hypothetical protein
MPCSPDAVDRDENARCLGNSRQRAFRIEFSCLASQPNPIDAKLAFSTRTTTVSRSEGEIARVQVVQSTELRP